MPRVDSDDGRVVPSFCAKLSNLGVMLPGLRGIWNGKRDQHVIVEAYPEDAFRFTTTDASKSMQCVATVNSRLMDSWQVSDEVLHSLKPVTFRVNLSVLIDCLSMGVSSETRLEISYEPEEELLSLVLSEGDVTTESRIKVLYEDADQDRVDFGAAFAATSQCNKCIIASERLKDAFFELSDLPGASTISVLLSPQAPCFRLSTLGQAGCCDVEFPLGNESFTVFECPHTFQFDYRLSMLIQAAKPLGECEKTFMRLNADGMLALQHLVRLPDGEKTYIDFLLLADAGLGEDQQQ